MSHRTKPEDTPFPEDLRYQKVYKLRGRMQFRGAPVEWNPMARIWCGTDRREHLRRLLRKIACRLPSTSATARLLLRITDDRESQRYTPRQQTLRRLLNTQADVEARQAFHLACKYWRKRQQRAK